MENGATTVRKTHVPYLYFFSTIAQMVCNTIAGTYLSFYITEKMGLSNIMMGSVMLVARTIDLIIGMSVGAFVQKVSFRPGQYRFWLLWGPIAVGLGTTLLFINLPVSVFVKSIQIVIGYIGYGGGMSFIQIASSGMLSKVSGADFNLRMSISSKIVQGQNTGRILTSLITLPLITVFLNRGVDGYTIMQVIFASLGVIGQMVLFIGTKGFETYDPDFKGSGAATVKLSEMLSTSLKNRQLVILMLADILRGTVTMSLAALQAYYFRYAVQDISKMTYSLTISSIVSLAGSFVAQPIAKKVGKKNSALISGVIAVLGYGALSLFGQGNWIRYIVFTSFASFGIMIITACGVNLYLDCAEYQQYETGIDNKTFVMSMYGVTIKVGFVISSVVVSGILQLSGYDAVTSTVADRDLMSLLIGAVPAAFYFCYLLFMAFLYKITEEKSKEYALANAQRVAKPNV